MRPPRDPRPSSDRPSPPRSGPRRASFDRAPDRGRVRPPRSRNLREDRRVLTAGPNDDTLTPEALAIRLLSLSSPDHPLDATIRETLASQGNIPREVGSAATQLVFLVQRWRGWLTSSMTWRHQIARARELAAQFDAFPAAFSDSELLRAVPAWTSDHVDIRTDWLRTLQTDPALWIRSRPGHAPELAADLEWTIPFGSTVPDALRYTGTEDLYRTDAFQKGRFEIQDLGSQFVSVLAAPKPGETWWDCCAGEGGKTLHLADLLGNKGVVWATDRAEWRLHRLRVRAARAGLFNIRRERWEGGPKRPSGTLFDGALVDAPCSGIGTWQKNPHARWTTTPKDVAELAARQLSLLRSAARGIKPGGRLVYAVCTISRAETLEVAKAFEAATPEFEPCPAPFHPSPSAIKGPSHHVWIHPEDHTCNGMFVALWKRTVRKS